MDTDLQYFDGKTKKVLYYNILPVEDVIRPNNNEDNNAKKEIK